MKRLLVPAACCLFTTSFAFADNGSGTNNFKTITNDFKGIGSTIPASVKLSPDIRVQAPQNINSSDNYIVDMHGNRYSEEAMYTGGNLVSYKAELKNPALPAAVSEALKTKYPSAVIKNDKEIIHENDGIKKQEYKVAFKNGSKKYAAKIEEDGTLLHMHRRFL